MKTKKILAIIPARGGSKGIPRKNIYPLAGKPLLAWSVEAALKSKYIDRVIVSSDDDEILEVAEKHGAEPIRRPKAMAGDKSPFNLLIFHALDFLKKKENYIPDIVVYLQPTSPLRTSKDIDETLALLKGETECAISVCEIENKILKAFLINKKGYLQGVSNNKFPFMNRQDLPKVYMPNGSIYVIKRQDFAKTGKLFTKETVPSVMQGDKNLDIDSMEDMKKVEKILKEKIRQRKTTPTR